MNKSSATCFRAGQRVRLNELGRNASLGAKGEVWLIGDAISAPDHPVHPERYVLDPPHAIGPVSGMFLESAE